MNKTILAINVLFLFFLNSVAIGQQNKIFIHFDSRSSEMCNIPKVQQGRYHGLKEVKKYEKTEPFYSNEEVLCMFYICKELFVLESEDNVKKCDIDYFKKIKFSKIEDLIGEVNKVNPLYPFKVFEEVILVEKINEQEIYLYDVKWLYYIE